MKTVMPVEVGLRLEERIRLELSGFSGKMGIYADDFKGNLIKINADEEWETASCIKVLILAELLRRVADGEVSLDAPMKYVKEHYTTGSGILKSLTPGLTLSIRDLATLMIIVSDNTATNMMIDYLGIEQINQTAVRMGLKKTRLHSKLFFPLENGNLGTTTPEEYGRIFKLFYEKRFGNEETQREFFSILKKQHYNTMLTRALAPGLRAKEDENGNSLIEIASKTGSLDLCRNDGGVFFTPWGDYVICIYTKDFSDKNYHDKHEVYHYGSRVSRIIFDHFLSKVGSLAE